MAQVNAPGGNVYGLSIYAPYGTHHWRFIGLEITGVSGQTYRLDGGLVLIGDGGNGMTNSTLLPHHFIFDRCYIHPWDMSGAITDINQVAHGITANCDNFATVDCDIRNLYHYQYDCQCVTGATFNGPLLLRNNYLESVGENWMWGGTDTPFVVTPSDISIYNNSHYKRTAWYGGYVLVAATTATGTAGQTFITVASATGVAAGLACAVTGVSGYANGQVALVGSAYVPGSTTVPLVDGNGTPLANLGTVSGTCNFVHYLLPKNMCEFKVGTRAAVYNNFYANSWQGAVFGGQEGQVFTVSVTNQSGADPLNVVQDIDIYNNYCTNVSEALKINDNYFLQVVLPPNRIRMRNNFFLINNPNAKFQFITFKNGTPSVCGDYIIDHNTCVMSSTPGAGQTGFFWTGYPAPSVNPQNQNVALSNNILSAYDGTVTYFLERQSAVNTYSILDDCVTPGTHAWVANAIVGASAGAQATFPSGGGAQVTYWPASISAVGFNNVGAGDYSLGVSSSYKGVGVSGVGLSATALGTPDGSDLGCNFALLTQTS